MTREHLERIRLWIEALRSGEYKQERGSLRYTDHYCCLGVACDVFLKKVGVGEWIMNGYGSLFKLMGHSTGVSWPDAVRDWFGLCLADESVLVDGKNPMYANDSLEWTFEQIADALERRYFPKESQHERGYEDADASTRDGIPLPRNSEDGAGISPA